MHSVRGRLANHQTRVDVSGHALVGLACHSFRSGVFQSCDIAPR
jgi:hypothetical protein